MEDVSSEAHTIDEVIMNQKDTIQVLKEGGFPLRKWHSNEPSLLKWLTSDLLIADPKLLPEEGSVTFMLGLSWQPREDVFTDQM